jgi:hypothetical protein
MARPPSFRDLLAQYRAAFKARHRGSADREHLDEWAKDPRAEQIWRKLTARHSVDANEFISRVLAARRKAKATLARFTYLKEGREYWSDYYRKRARKADTADKLSALSEARREAEWVFDAQEELLLPNPLPISRQRATALASVHDRRVIRLFVLDVSAYWRERCGSPGDAKIAFLTEIAFPGLYFDAEQGRDLRSARKQGRKTGKLRHQKTG